MQVHPVWGLVLQEVAQGEEGEALLASLWNEIVDQGLANGTHERKVGPSLHSLPVETRETRDVVVLMFHNVLVVACRPCRCSCCSASRWGCRPRA